MASKKKLSKSPSHYGLGHFIRTLFEHKKEPVAKEKSSKKEICLEPKDWPEVRDFIKRLNNLIESNTILDHNVQRLNQRIVDRVESQINEKGQLQDIDQRFNALDTIADRFLNYTLNRIVGLRSTQIENEEFSQVITHFKNRLHERYKEELALKEKNSLPRPN